MTLSPRIPLAFALLLALACCALAQKPGAKNPLGPQPPQQTAEPLKTPPSPPAELTAADVSAFLDGVVPLQMERNDVAGAVVVVVKDGKILFAKGYGYADVEKRSPVSSADTLFRPGSISKLFTWTAVMQLVEQGKLDLDRDVNDYLDFKVPATYSKPITLRDIMTHTPGFEETDKDLLVTEPKARPPLRQYLVEHMPARIFPPGAVPAYSNYATALAGYIVQRVSGEKYEDYIQNHILTTLGMTHASFAQPLPAALQPLMSKGYDKGSGKPKEFEIVVPSPAGALSVSGDDMARFMIAHLQDGEFEGRQILKPETARLMHSRQFGLAPDLNAMCLGFYEESRNGQRIIGHGGDTQWFHSDLHLVLDQHLGFFISGNSAGKGDISLRTAVWRKFLDRYFPYTPPAAAPSTTKIADAKTVSGEYLTSRRFQTNILTFASLLDDVSIKPNSDGTIQTDTLKGFNGQPKKFEEIAPLHYREVGGQDKLDFLRDSSGRLFIAFDYPFMEFQSIPWYKHAHFLTLVLIALTMVFLLTLVFWPIAALVRHHYQRPLAPTQPGLRLAVRIVCILELAVLAAWAIIFSKMINSLPTDAYDPWLHLAQVITLIGVIATVVAFINVFRAWNGPRWWWTRIWDTLIGLACVGFIWIVFFCHLLQWSLNY